MQAAFVRHDGYQCGYCTPGQICSAVGMMDEVKKGWPSHVTEDLGAAELTVEEISERMSGNLCRCAAYPNIVDAIRDVAGLGDRNPNEDVGRGRGMKLFDYARADLGRDRHERRSRTRRALHRRGHQPARPDEIAGRDA